MIDITSDDIGTLVKVTMTNNTVLVGRVKEVEDRILVTDNAIMSRMRIKNIERIDEAE